MLTFVTLKGMLADTPEALKERVGHDYNNQLSFIEGMRAVVGHDPAFNPRFVDKRGKDGKFTEHSSAKVTVPKNVTTVQFLVWAYGVSYSTFKRWKVEEFKWTKNVAAHAGKSVLTDVAFAQTIYTPQRIFITSKMAEWYESQRVQSRRVDPQAKRNHRACLKIAWTRLSAEEKVPYDKMSRDHHARQPLMKECLVDALQKKTGGNCLRSYRSLEKATDGWCSHSTIEHWLKSQPTFTTYSKKVRPGLMEANREKQVQFAHHVFSNWGLPRTQKILWTMSDVR
jgi:hypothetical protein